MANTKTIYFDGGDGSGKTTQIELAKKALEDSGSTVLVTRALGGSSIGEKLRNVILSDLSRPPETDMHIALASQYALIKEITGNNFDYVLIDRSPLSIIAYQAYADKMDKKLAISQVNLLLDNTNPDLIMVFDANANDLNSRRIHRNNHNGTDYFESKDITYHQKVAEGYRFAGNLYNAELIDATKSIDTIHRETMGLINALK